MIRTDRRLRLCLTLLVCCLVFIWGNSLLPGQVSGAFSDWVGDILEELLPGEQSPPSGGGKLRKIAHFTEFGLLGMCLAWLMGMLQKKTAWAFVLGTAAACVDETIQRFVPGRGPSLKDVAIDAGGVLTGVLLICLGYAWCKRKRKKKVSFLEDKLL